MAEFKISRIRYTWKNVWTTGTEYDRDDIVRVGSKTYVCIVGHTAASSFYSDLDDNSWTLMSEGSTWRGIWTDARLYNLNDLVYYGGVTYICTTSHTSQSTFDANFTDWTEYISTVEWNSDWLPNHRYGVGDLVKYNGIVYRCVAGHTSASSGNGLEVGNYDAYQDSTGETWEVYNSGIEYRGNWDNLVRYRANDLVKYGGTIWKCVTPHTSGDDSTLNFNSEYFTVELPGEQFQGAWDDISTYSVGDVVRYGGYLYVCRRNDINEIPSTETSAWTLLTKNYNVRGDWNRRTDYKTGDIVRRGGQLFIATGDNSGAIYTDETTIGVTVGGPGSGDTGNKYYFDSAYIPNLTLSVGSTYTFVQTNQTNLWYPNATGTTLNTHPLMFSIVPESVAHPTNDYYTNGVTYYLNELVVTRQEYIDGFATANTRRITLTVTSQTPAIIYYWCLNHRNMGNQFAVEVTTLGAEPSTGASWTLLVPGENWRGGWTAETEYAVGDLVGFSSSTYRCIASHRALTNENFPTNGNGYDYWTLYLSGDDSNALANPGDLLTYGARSDESTLGTIAVPVGTTRELLTVNSDETSLGYLEHGAVHNFLYVSLTGVDDLGYGLTLGTPFKTIRYAAEYAEQNFAGAPTTISVKTGHYFEILPIIIPVNTAIVGDETRSVIVEPAPAVANLSLDANYTIAVLGRMKDIMNGLLSDNPIVPTAGNIVPQNTEYPIAGSGVATTVSSMIDDTCDYINYHINSVGSSEPTMFGTNTETTDTGVINAISILEGNKEFLKAEAVAYMRLNFPNYAFDGELCKRDISRYIDAWEWDLKYSSNYRSLLAARYYRNAITGSEGEDMFYARNATGVRNMTLQGLVGELGAVVDAELFNRPTGGSFVSLDPGWGPDDERCWINSRSPYIQNCCTFGYGTVGQKIDGSLHNGGYKSMVSNDFTQIISDGIGAYVLNGGRAELVSVFTYYSQIGYFAENGGVIRATNGNNSYGRYGAIASGNDPTETPYYANVNNETNEAVIIDAFAGEVNDEILALEFAHCGQNYSTATYTFVGSGTGAIVAQEDFRDNAVFQARPISANGIDSPGGGGFTEFGNNAQEGNTLTIKLASNDPHSPEEIIGLRLTITSGTGTGQYGWIQAYNEITKIATIYKESTNEPGWDHIVAGYPIVDTITTSAVYRVEPRVTFSEPGFTATEISISANTSWANVVYSETYETYNDIAGTAGAGTIDVELTPITATWNVIKDGRSYIVSNNNPGAGYAANQTITISGALLGGTDTEHDVTIIITEISDDSTNSIVSFVSEGIAASGRFVATPSTGTSYAWSEDGETWTTYTLPTAGNWKALAAGNKTYVAAAYNSSDAVYSKDGKAWTTASMPAVRNWTAISYGSGVFLAVANNSNIGAYSTNGTTWTAVTLPVGNQWADVTYGAGKFVAVENDSNIVAIGTYDAGTWTWDSVVLDVIADSTPKQWTGIAFGNNRFVAISNTGEGAWSFDAVTWYPMAANNHIMPEPDDSTEHNWQMIRYGQGVFFAVGDTGNRVVGGDATTGPTTFAATSPDGVTWTARTLPTLASYVAVGFGNPDITLGDSTASNNKPTWIVLHNGTSGTTSSAVKVYTGARALGRVVVNSGLIDSVKIWDPGSGYDTAPTLTITDPSNTAELVVDNRLGDGVLAQPSWINRGASYKTSSTTVTVTGNGFADILPTGKFITLDNLDRLPSPGAQFRFAGASNYYTVVTISQEGVDVHGKILATFRISPTLTVLDEIQHNTQVEIREQYSQIRITGHDFLDIGTGNILETNYPELYSTGLYLLQPENEIYEKDGGRVFYTSTDQDGNFRTGELFAVEQATGVVTISADFFNLDGLTELALGGVRLGGSGTVIREFSTDPLFIADSNNIVPTQRAIKAYLQTRLSVGGSDLQIPSFIAGVVWVGPTSIRTTTGVQIELPARMDFGNHAVKGTMLAQTMFIGSFNND